MWNPTSSQGLFPKKCEAWLDRRMVSNRNELSRKRGKVSRPCCPRVWSKYHEGVPPRTLPYTRCSHRDPPLHLALPGPSLYTRNAHDFLPCQQRFLSGMVFSIYTVIRVADISAATMQGKNFLEPRWR